MSSFGYTFPLQGIAELLPLRFGPAEMESITTALALLVDRDTQLENFLASVLVGRKGSQVITATTGGKTITFAKPFARTPSTVLVCLGDSAAGAIVNVVNATVTATGFDVQVWDAAGVEQNGVPFRINWIAVA